MANLEESLEAVLTPREDKRVSIKDILNNLFSLTNIKQKSILSDTNISALMKMRAANEYLNDTYGFEITQFDRLIEDKLVFVISKDGRGRQDFVKVIESMRDTIYIEEKEGWFKR